MALDCSIRLRLRDGVAMVAEITFLLHRGPDAPLVAHTLAIAGRSLGMKWVVHGHLDHASVLHHQHISAVAKPSGP